MVNVYEDLRDRTGNLIIGRTKLFLKSSNLDGVIEEYLSGVACVPEGSGVMFIVDEWLIDQLDKVQFIDGTLSTKDGEELMPPGKSERELQIEAIERQLAALKADTEEPTNELTE